MLLTPAQAVIARDNHRFRVINCGRRFGKTTLAVEEIKGVALSKEARICYIAPTIQQARDIAWAMLIKELQPIIIKAVESPSREITVKSLNGGSSLIQLRGWEAIETLRGQAFDFILIDEVASMRNFWLQWQEVIRPTLTDRKGQVMFISTPKGFNHFYDLYNLENKDEDYKSFHFTSYDNTYIPRDEIDKAKKELTEDRFAQEYLADFRKTEGLVYKEFSREKHLYGEELQIGAIEKIGGIDFGFTNPCAIVKILIDADRNYYIDKEWYQTGKTEAQVAEYAYAEGFNAVYPDPESPSAIEELRKKGLNIREVIKNKDSIKSGIQKVRELFKAGRLKVNKNCINVIYELETYSYPPRGEVKDPDTPIKENDHAMDAIRYALATREANQGIGGNTVKTYIPHFTHPSMINKPKNLMG